MNTNPEINPYRNRIKNASDWDAHERTTVPAWRISPFGPFDDWSEETAETKPMVEFQ